MKIHRTTRGYFLESGSPGSPVIHELDETTWVELFQSSSPHALLEQVVETAPRADEDALEPSTILAPISERQEVWAAGVTYFRSRDARKEESESAGGGDFYDRVYEAERPELFYKSSGPRVVGPGGPVRVREDSSWNVPEPELTLALNAYGEVIGYTIGNDMSSRDIEGENPLYLPQAKVYDGSCALGPVLLVPAEPLPSQTGIRLAIERQGEVVLEESTEISQIKRTFEELAGYLFRETSFPEGCYLMTGTGIIPPTDFSLQSGDRIRITIEPVGVLENVVD